MMPLFRFDAAMRGCYAARSVCLRARALTQHAMRKCRENACRSCHAKRGARGAPRLMSFNTKIMRRWREAIALMLRDAALSARYLPRVLRYDADDAYGYGHSCSIRAMPRALYTALRMLRAAAIDCRYRLFSR